MAFSTHNNTSHKILELIKELFPIARSITGEGVRKTLQVIKRELPLLTIHEIPSGTKCFDWTIPEEWNVFDAYVIDPSGKKILDFKDSNLHVVSYSLPFSGRCSLVELKEHLYSLPELPNAIPYVTSYYTPRWGLCMKHADLLQLREGEYEVKIESEFKKGSLSYGELIIPGKTEDEILLSTYVCHPSMANNELSGPALTVALAKEIMANKNREYTYRILFVPETIGAIAYLSKHKDVLKERTRAGYVVTCVGKAARLTYIPSRSEKALVDKITKHVLDFLKTPSKVLSYMERGSDERQYCWPGIDLPVGSLMGDKYGSFPEYHTSLDNLEFISVEELQTCFQAYQRCIESLEKNRYYQTSVLCEPQLGKRGLYSTLGTSETPVDGVKIINFLSCCDGDTSLLEIAQKMNLPIWELHEIASLCLKEKLLNGVSEKNYTKVSAKEHLKILG